LIYKASEFVFKPPAVISRARRVLIKPAAAYPIPYPVSSSRELLSSIIRGIRQVSEADILILESTPGGGPVYPIYQQLAYDFPRVLMLDVRDCIWVEVDNPLPKPLAVPTFWVPNVILSSDYLISVTPMKVIQGRANLSIMNLLSLLPTSKYSGDKTEGWGALSALGMDKVLADLYFTLPFDLGIIEGKQLFTSNEDPTQGKTEKKDQIYIGEPYETDLEATAALGAKAEYLDLIREAKVGFEF
jgi:hypothetical protein